MSLHLSEEARRLIEDAGGGHFVGPRPETLIVAAEAALGVRFPPSYRLHGQKASWWWSGETLAAGA